jgi:hypothetical protein
MNTPAACRDRHRNLPAGGQWRRDDPRPHGAGPARSAAIASASHGRASMPKTCAAASAMATTTLVRGLPIPGYAGLKFGLPAARLLCRQWRAERPDVVQVVTEGPLGASAIGAARELGIPVVSEFHTNFHAYSRHYGFAWLENLVAASPATPAQPQPHDPGALAPVGRRPGPPRLPRSSRRRARRRYPAFQSGTPQ